MSDTTPSTPLTRRLGSELAALRVASGLSQYAVAAALGQGQGQVHRIEHGQFARLSAAEAYAGSLGYEITVGIKPKEQG